MLLCFDFNVHARFFSFLILISDSTRSSTFSKWMDFLQKQKKPIKQEKKREKEHEAKVLIEKISFLRGGRGGLIIQELQRFWE